MKQFFLELKVKIVWHNKLRPNLKELLELYGHTLLLYQSLNPHSKKMKPFSLKVKVKIVWHNKVRPNLKELLELSGHTLLSYQSPNPHSKKNEAIFLESQS
jgi:hypothetical protein